MSEFENRLSESLAQRAEGAPAAGGLADAARARSRRRRTTRVMAGGAAAVVAMIGIPVGISALGINGAETPVTTQPQAQVRGLPAGWRWESYHDLEFLVPSDWGYGPLSQYCISSNSNPVVERPGGVSTEVACPTPLGYGALVSLEGDAPTLDNTYVPQGAAFGQVTDAGVTLTVVAKQQGVVDDVLASAKAYPGPDYYGCEAEVAVPALGEMPAVVDLGADRNDPLSVCRYAIGVDGPNLLGSETLTGDNIEKAWLGIDALEPGDGPNPSSKDCLESPETEAVLLTSGSEPKAWVHYSGCTTHGVDVGGQVFQLNEQVMWAAMSPNSGGFGVGGEVPLPKEFRR